MRLSPLFSMGGHFSECPGSFLRRTNPDTVYFAVRNSIANQPFTEADTVRGHALKLSAGTGRTKPPLFRGGLSAVRVRPERKRRIEKHRTT